MMPAEQLVDHDAVDESAQAHAEDDAGADAGDEP